MKGPLKLTAGSSAEEPVSDYVLVVWWSRGFSNRTCYMGNSSGDSLQRLLNVGDDVGYGFDANRDSDQTIRDA